MDAMDKTIDIGKVGTVQLSTINQNLSVTVSGGTKSNFNVW